MPMIYEKRQPRDNDYESVPFHLMMNVVIIGVIAAEHLERIPSEPVAAMIVDRLEGRDDEEKSCFPSTHACDCLRYPRTDAVEEEALNRMVVQRAERVRDVKTVVHGVEGLVKVCVHVHGAVQEIFPCVDDEPCHEC